MQPDNFQSGAKINDVAPEAPKSYSSFPLSYRFMQTQRLGEITPHACWTIEGAFKPALRCMHDLDTYTLKAPLKTDIYEKRNNFSVALQAILPHSQQLIEAQPTEGDDVPQDCDGVVKGSQIHSLLYSLLSTVTTTNWSQEEEVDVSLGMYLSSLIRKLLVLEMFGSQGSLLKQLKYDFSHLFRFQEYFSGTSYKVRTLDAFLEQVLGGIAPVSSDLTGIHSFEVYWFNEDGEITDEYLVVDDSRLSSLPTTDGIISYRHFLDRARQDLNFLIGSVDASSSFTIEYEEESEESFVYSLSAELAGQLFGNYLNYYYDKIQSSSFFNDTYNFDMLSAYQLVCAHFYTSDYVDYIYTADLFRQLIQFYDDQVTAPATAIYTWNGVNIRYDALSGFYFTKQFIKLISDINSMYSPDISDGGYFHSFACNFMTALFSFRHNLRYKDYFTGGRTKPLSVGDVGVAVSGGEVNAVDIILKQNTARLFNWAARVGKKWNKQSKKKTGIEPAFDYHDPKWISGTGDLVGISYTQNTGEAQVSKQNSITSKMKSNANRFQFNFEADRRSFIICLTSYDIPRCYAFATDRENFVADRYDMFQPFFQYNGSQAVLSSELGIVQRADIPFAYQGRYMHLKQKYDICAGGFLEFLPGYAFIADTAEGVPMQRNLSPSYIRTWNSELDPFFVKLTGYSLAAYFHFIVKNTNIINEQAPMEYNPQLM